MRPRSSSPNGCWPPCRPEAGLDTVMFVNSGSEANDLAWRLATTFTGHRGALCSAFAYHGVSEATAALSPESWQATRRPEHVETWEAPRIPFAGRISMASRSPTPIARLATRGHVPAAAILDSVLTSDGYIDPRAGPGRRLGRTDAGSRWPVDRRRGPGRPRPHRAAHVVVPAPRPDPGCRHARQADGQRASGRGGRDAA